MSFLLPKGHAKVFPGVCAMLMNRYCVAEACFGALGFPSIKVTPTKTEHAVERIRLAGDRLKVHGFGFVKMALRTQRYCEIDVWRGTLGRGSAGSPHRFGSGDNIAERQLRPAKM